MSRATHVNGTATIATVTDMEPMLRQLVVQHKTDNGLPAHCSDAELQAAASRFVSDFDQSRAEYLVEAKRQIAQGLMDGVSLAGMELTRDHLLFISSTTFRFDDVNKLKAIVFTQVAGGGDGAALKPFESFRIEQGKGKLVVEGAPPAFGAATAAAPAEVLERNKVSFALELPLQPVEHNATQAEGQRLRWEYNLARLSDPGQQPPVMRATFSTAQ
ncbi:MAG: hypothetical protein AB2A00_10130 [Myxococcota bacterium]